MIREEINQYNPNPRLMGCDRKGNFHGIHVPMPAHSRAYAKNQSYTSGCSRMKGEMNDAYDNTLSPASILSIHPAIAKAWVTFSGINGEVFEGFNILAVHKRTTGSYLISFIIPMASTTYVPIIIAEGFNVQAAPTLLRTHTMEITTKILEPSTKISAHDSHTVHAVVFGSLHACYL
ncbi:MAG: hypothetical protein ACRDAI_02060 [Candidatus Rhabdochlamydia sp.]